MATDTDVRACLATDAPVSDVLLLYKKTTKNNASGSATMDNGIFTYSTVTDIPPNVVRFTMEDDVEAVLQFGLLDEIQEVLWEEFYDI